MKLFRFILIYFLLTVLTIKGNYSAADTVSFYSNPILGRLTNSSVTISVLPKKNLDIYYELGTSPGIYIIQSGVQSASLNNPARTVISSLAANTRYYYRIRYRLSGTGTYTAGEEFTFITQRSKGTSFVFTVEADPHLYDKKGGHSLMRLCLQNQLADNPDFMIDLGDTFGDDHNPNTITESEIDLLHKNYIPYFGLLNHSAALYLCLGNHEGESGYYLLQNAPNNLAVYGTLARKKYYANPYPDTFYTGNDVPEGFGIGLPENYYSFEWGNALFVVLDVYRGFTSSAKPREWEWTLGETQYKWFKKVLEESNSKYRFVFAHHTLGETRGGINTAGFFEWGGYNSNGTTWGFDFYRPGWGVPIHQLMVNNKVNIFFQGHDHIFSKEMLDGIVYQAVPMPSDSTYTIGMTDNGSAYTGIKLDGSGHLRVTVAPSGVTVDYVKAVMPADEISAGRNRETAYSYTVTSSVASVEEKPEVPAGFNLYQNYPNPFNPETTIKFSIPKQEHVSLKIFNSLGQEIDSPINNILAPGAHLYKWNAGSNPAGVYFYQLRCGSGSYTGKMLLLK